MAIGGSRPPAASDPDEKPVDAKPLFRLDHGSASAFLAMRPDGPPPRKTWEADSAFARTNNNLFRLKSVSLPDINDRSPARYCKAMTSYNQKELFAHAAAQLRHHREDDAVLGRELDGDALNASATSFATTTSRIQSPLGSSGSPSKKGTQRRSDKYFDLLMKSHYKRVDGWKDEEEEEARQKAEAAATHARRKALVGERRKAAAERAETKSRSSDEESEVDSTDEPEDLVPLQPYDGKMKVELEISVLPSPDEDEPSQADTSVPPSSSHSSRPPSSKSSSEGERLDLANELAALEEEMKPPTPPPKDDESDDDLPEHLKLKKFGNIGNNPDPRWTLGIGGTVFFVPDAERYAFGPSLPPPPPPSLHGRKRLKIKPRLPLDISNHRYRDEHPNIWPVPPYSPELKDYARFEQTMLTVDLYKSCNKAMTQLPRLTRNEDLEKHKTSFGKIVERETKRSIPWKNYNHRQKLLKKEADRLAKVAAEKAEAAAKAKAMEAIAADEDEDAY